MKTLYLNEFVTAGLNAIGIKPHSLDDKVTGNDLRAIAEMIDIAEKRKEAIAKEKNAVTSAA